MKYIFLVFSVLSIFSQAQVSHKYIDVETLFSSPTNYAGTMSPDGKYFTYITNERNVPSLEFVELSTMRAMTGLELEKGLRLLGYQWLTPDVIYLRVGSAGRQEGYLLSIIAPANDESKVIRTQVQKLSSGYIVDPLANEPAYVLFARTTFDDNELVKRLYRIRMDRLKRSEFIESEYIETASQALKRYFYDSNNHLLLAAFYYAADKAVELKYKSLHAKRWTSLLTYKDDDFSVTPVGFINNDEIAVLTEKNAEKVGLYRFNIKTQSIGELLFEHERYDLTSATLSKQGELLAVEYIQGGLPKREWFNSYSKEIVQRFNISFDNGVARIIDGHLPSNTMLVFEHGPNNRGKYYVYDGNTDSLSELVSMYPDLDDIQYPSHDVFKVKAPDGVDIEAYLTRPSGIDHNTLIVMPHGGPVNVRDYNLFKPDIQYLANRGFSILRVNFRGSKGFGKVFKEDGKGQFGKQIEEDISLVVDEVLANNSFDNVCAIGASYGAYSSFMLTLKHPNLYKCIVASYGVYDLPLLFNQSNLKSKEDHQKRVAEVVGENSEEKIQLSPLYNAQNINVPVLLIAGKKDEVTGFEQTNRMRFVLEALDKEVDHLYYQRAGHGHSNWFDEQHENVYVLNFLNENLGIKQHEKSSLSETNKKIMAAEYALLAEGLSNQKIVNDNSTKKRQFLSEASALGSGEATFKLASLYHYGSDVDRNTVKAVELYKKAIEQNYEAANARLGKIYLGASDLPQNDELAFEYLTKAAESSSSNVAINMLARFYCQAGQEYKSLIKCKELFEQQISKISNNRERDDFYQNISFAIVQSNFTETERVEFTKFVVDLLDIDEPIYDLNVIDDGLWIYYENDRYARLGEYENVSDQAISSFIEESQGRDVSLGIKYRVDAPGLSSFDEVAFSVTIFEEFDSQNNKVAVSAQYNIDSARRIWIDRVSLNDHTQGHSYRYAVYDVEGTKLHERFFR